MRKVKRFKENNFMMFLENEDGTLESIGEEDMDELYRYWLTSKNRSKYLSDDGYTVYEFEVPIDY